jgi:hypothetical protein
MSSTEHAPTDATTTVTLEEGEIPQTSPSETSPEETPADTPAPAAETPLQPPKKQRVQKYTAIQKASFGDALERRNDVFIAPLNKPLNILSPTVTLTEGLYTDEGDLKDYVTLKLKKTGAEVFTSLENTLLETAKAKKVAWFQNADLSDDFLEKSLRRFADMGSRTLSVRVDEGLGGKTEVQQGAKVKVILQAEGATFTKTQFGFLWKMVLIKSIEKNEDMYLFDPEEYPETTDMAQGDLLSCMTAAEDDDDPADEFLQA